MIEADHHSSLHVDFGKFFPKTAFFILTQYRRVTDRRDGRTDRHVAVAITRASIASHG